MFRQIGLQLVASVSFVTKVGLSFRVPVIVVELPSPVLWSGRGGYGEKFDFSIQRIEDS